MKRLLRMGCLTIVLIVIGAAVLLTWQLSDLDDATRAKLPLPIVKPRVTAQDTARLRRQVRTASNTSGKLALSSGQLNYALQVTLARPEVLKLIAAGLESANEQLAETTDPLGILDDIHLDKVDVSRLQASAAVEGQRLQLRMTAPYKEGKDHLNLRTELTGRWNRGEAHLEMQKLLVGEKDLLSLPITGALLRRGIHSALDDALKAADGGGETPLLESAWLESDQLHLLPRPESAAALQQWIATLIFGPKGAP